jgi:CRP-like cAMP-binding protein
MIEIKRYFERMVNISDKDWEVFSSKLVKREFAKKSVILKIGQKENYLSFIEIGIVRKCIPQEFDDLTFEFAFAGDFVTAYDFFLTQQPSSYQLETITDTIFWSVSYDDLQTIYAKTDIGNTIGRLASEDLFMKKSKRELSLLTQSAESTLSYLLSRLVIERLSISENKSNKLSKNEFLVPIDEYIDVNEFDYMS